MKNKLVYLLVALTAIMAVSLSFFAFADNDYPTDKDGNFYVPEYVFGDVNRDGKLTASDARLALRNAARLEELDIYQTIIADVNNDRSVTPIDARLILRAAARLEIPIEKHVHTIVGSPEAPASCTKDGKTSSLFCKTCAMVFKEQEILPAGHVIVRKEVPPTCEEPGYTFIEICERCGEIFARGDLIPAKGHTIGDDGIHCDECGKTVIDRKDYDVLSSGIYTIEGRTYTRFNATDPKEPINIGINEDEHVKITSNENASRADLTGGELDLSLVSQKTDYSRRSYIISESNGICARYDKLMMKFARIHINLSFVRNDADDGSGMNVMLTKDVEFNGVKADMYTFTSFTGKVIANYYFVGDKLIAMEEPDSRDPDCLNGILVDSFSDAAADISFTPGADYKEVNSLMFIYTVARDEYADYI